MKTTVFTNPFNLLEASDNRICVITTLIQGTLSFKISGKKDVLYSARAESVIINKGHLLYVAFNLFSVEDLCISSTGRKMYFLSGVNYEQFCTRKVLNNQSREIS